MEFSKVYLVGVVSFLFLPLVVSDSSIRYEIKRLIPRGPNPAQSPDPIPSSSHSFVSDDIGFQHEVKRCVPTRPNLT